MELRPRKVDQTRVGSNLLGEKIGVNCSSESVRTFVEPRDK